MSPAVSICIPVYNAEAHVGELIEAVIGQSFTDWELIIVNNASTDSTAGILEKRRAAHSDLRIKVFTNDHILKMVENFNAAIGKSTGEFIKLICADDLPTKDCLERQVLALRSHPDAVMTAGARIIINHHGKKLFKRSGIGKTGIYAGRDIIRRCIMAGTNIIGDPVSVMWRRSAMEQVGVFDPTVVYCTDIEYWLRLLSVGDLYYDTEPVGFYRIHGNAATIGLAKVTVQDFLHTAKLQAQRGSVTLSNRDLRIVGLKSHVQSIIRQNLYRILG